MVLDHHVEIDNKTRIGLFTVIGILPVVVFVAFFISLTHFQGEANAARIEVVNIEQEKRMDRQGAEIREIRTLLIELKSSTSRIEAAVEVLKRKQ